MIPLLIAGVSAAGAEPGIEIEIMRIAMAVGVLVVFGAFMVYACFTCMRKKNRAEERAASQSRTVREPKAKAVKKSVKMATPVKEKLQEQSKHDLEANQGPPERESIGEKSSICENETGVDRSELPSLQPIEKHASQLIEPPTPL